MRYPSDRHLGEGSRSNACNLVGIDCNRLQSILHAVADIAPTDSNAPASFREIVCGGLLKLQQSGMESNLSERLHATADGCGRDSLKVWIERIDDPLVSSSQSPLSADTKSIVDNSKSIHGYDSCGWVCA